MVKGIRATLRYYWPPVAMLAFSGVFIGGVLFVASRPMVCHGSYNASRTVLYASDCHLKW